MPRATLVATVTAPPDAASLEWLSRQSDWLEVRADRTGDLDPAALRARYRGRLLYTLRSREEGGAGVDGGPRRIERLLAAAAQYDLVDLEAARDLVPALLGAVPAEKRVLSWHGAAPDLSSLRTRFEEMARLPAALYKLVPAARQAGEELLPLALLQALGRRDVAAFASGPVGAWTRFLAPRLGAPVVYGAASPEPGAPGQLALATLRRDYGLPDLPPVERICGVVGNPVFHSLSPRLHNGAYRALGVPLLYLPFQPPSFADFWLEVVERGSLALLGFPLAGLSVTAPFKDVAAAVAGAASPLVNRLSSANTLVENQGVWEAETTDPEGVALACEAAGVAVAGRRAAVVGAGGAGRAAAAGLALAGALVTVVNRSSERGRQAAADLRLPFLPLASFDPRRFDLLVNATTLGRQRGEALPFPLDGVGAGAAVVDLVYTEGPTALLASARERGLAAVDGREVLLFQARRQFRWMTGRDLPVDLGRELLGVSPNPAALGGAGP